MAVNISEIIPKQGFEVVLYKIAEILFSELSNQKTAHSNMPDFSVFVERMTPYDKSEGVMINVTSGSANYGNFTESTTQSKTDFNIEVYSPLEHVFIKADDSISETFTLHKVVGMVRYILQSTKYKTLDLPLGLIGGTYVESIQFFDDFNNKEGANIRIATLGFSVRIMENQDLWNGTELKDNVSQIKLGQTELGYKLIKNI